MTDKTDIAALLGKLKFFAGEASCHPDPNYSLEFEKLCTPSNILALLDQIEVVSKSEWKLAGELVELQMTFNALQKKDNSCTLGVGEGSGRLFVHGDYESIKATQKIILERDALKAKLDNPVVVPAIRNSDYWGGLEFRCDKYQLHVFEAIHAAGFTTVKGA